MLRKVLGMGRVLPPIGNFDVAFTRVIARQHVQSETYLSHCCPRYMSLPSGYVHVPCSKIVKFINSLGSRGAHGFEVSRETLSSHISKTPAAIGLD